ncbi:hypothetical protein [Paenibacillus sp.]|uniref:hypothetical protein n=1 Tax=Paenibacillus sp. TaxID=58172 RepID=UPI002D3E89F3|nr:hypothetical protein [Paenibacillus sp.]HZG57502.1 hypothetical protein [Paenibacillus sp.]
MVEEMTAIFAAYGMGVCLVHLLGGRRLARTDASHAVIVTRDAGASVEWHLRMLALAQWARPRHTRITLIDEGSEDETLRIAERLMSGMNAEWELIRARTPAEAQRWLERLASEAAEVRIVRGPLVGGAGSAV